MNQTFLIRLASVGFRFGIFFLAVSVASVMVFGSPAALKQALRDSGAYTSAAKAIASQASRSMGVVGGDSAVKTAAIASFTPPSVQNTAEKSIDDVYSWLNGESDKPNIRIDLRPYIAGFNQNLGNSVSQRASSLQPCTAEQLRKIDLKTSDIFNLPCLPPGANVASIKDQAVTKATASNDFLQNPVITADTLPKDSNGRTIIDRAAGVPAVYQWLRLMPWMFGGLALVCAIAILVLWRNNWRLAVQKLARISLVSGLTLLILVASARLTMWYLSKPDSVASQLIAGTYRDIILSFTYSLERAFDSKLLLFGVAYIAVSAVIIAALHFIKKRARPNIQNSTPIVWPKS